MILFLFLEVVKNFSAILVNEDCWNFFINNGIEGYSKDKFNYPEPKYIFKDSASGLNDKRVIN